ncbi:MAG: nucleotide exchange factor GrpE [Chloroflexota bacterium]
MNTQSQSIDTELNPQTNNPDTQPLDIPTIPKIEPNIESDAQSTTASDVDDESISQDETHVNHEDIAPDNNESISAEPNHTESDSAGADPIDDSDTDIVAASDTIAEVDAILHRNVVEPDAAADILAAIQQMLGGLQRDFTSKIHIDTNKDHMIDTLHQELQAYKEGLHFKILRPILHDLISLYNDLEKILQEEGQAGQSTEETNHHADAQLRDNMQSFLWSIEDILAKHDVELFSSSDTPFDGRRQRSLGTIPTAHPAQAHRVARSVRKGFIFEDRILQQEWVYTYHVEMSSDIKNSDAEEASV